MIGSPRVGVPRRGKSWIGVPMGSVSVVGGGVIAAFQPSLKFDDPRNSQYVPMMFSKQDWSIERENLFESNRFLQSRNQPTGVV